MSNEFRSAQTVEVSQAQYVLIFSPSSTRRRAIRLGVTAILGVFCLLWSYTLLLGVGLLLLTFIALAIPRLLPAGRASVYRSTPHLQRPFTCGVSDTEIWVDTPLLKCVSKWENLVTWREIAGWLMLTAKGMPSAFYRIEVLQRDGLYERVMTLARSHGKEARL
jgi:hypothetical protein